MEALQIITCKDSDVSDIVIRLGGLHTLMSFLPSIGPIMAESGNLKQALAICYAENIVPHIFSGKAVNRALRAHQLVDLELNTVLLETNAEENGNISLPDTKELANLHDDLVSNQITADDVCSQPILSDLADAT